MSSSSQEIETIVRMVIDRLRDNAVSTGTGTRSNAVASLSPEPETLVIAEPLVTLKSLDNRLQGIKTLRVLPRSVVTPAVADELRRNGIGLVRSLDTVSKSAADRTNQSAKALSTADFCVVVPSQKFPVIQAVNKHLSIGFIEDSKSDARIVEELSCVFTSSVRAVWSASRPYAAQSACNRIQQNLSAVCLMQAADLQLAIEQAQPNLIIVDDNRWSGFQIAKLIHVWSQAKPRGGAA